MAFEREPQQIENYFRKVTLKGCEQEKPTYQKIPQR